MDYQTERVVAVASGIEGLLEDTFNPNMYQMFMEAIREDALYNYVDEETLREAIESDNHAALGKEIARGVYNYCYARAEKVASDRFDDRDRIRDAGSNYLRVNNENF